MNTLSSKNFTSDSIAWIFVCSEGLSQNASVVVNRQEIVTDNKWLLEVFFFFFKDVGHLENKRVK